MSWRHGCVKGSSCRQQRSGDGCGKRQAASGKDVARSLFAERCNSGRGNTAATLTARAAIASAHTARLAEMAALSSPRSSHELAAESSGCRIR